MDWQQYVRACGFILHNWKTAFEYSAFADTEMSVVS